MTSPPRVHRPNERADPFPHEAKIRPAPTNEANQESPTYAAPSACCPVGRFDFGAAGGKNYLADISATVVSSMRFEKPHSLSYQDDTFTRRPDTLVRVASNVLDAGLWLKSTETRGSVL